MNVERDAIPWWRGLRDDQPVVQRCQACRAWRWPARALCNRCGSFDAAWEPVSRRARVASWIVNHHAFSRAFAVPYTIILGRLDEQADLILPGLFRGDAAQLSIGAEIYAAIDTRADSTQNDADALQAPILTWNLAASAAQA